MKIHTIIIILLIIIVMITNMFPKLTKTLPFLNLDIFNMSEDIRYVFWTGGYDSTFRICELLIIENLPVQPIYISYNLDSEKKSDLWVRKNRKQEKDAMKKIRKILNIRFPYTKDLFKKTIYITKNIKDTKYNNKFLELKLWPTKRKIHQYNHLGKISFKKKIYIDTGVLGLKKTSEFGKFLNTHIQPNNRLNVSKDNPLHYLCFPLLNKTKKQLCDISKNNNFHDIIRVSWSCWFPINNKPCHKCPMCIERFQCN